MNDKSIPLDWIKSYTDAFMEIAEKLEDGLLKDATLRRIEVIFDLVEAYKKRNNPLGIKK